MTGVLQEEKQPASEKAKKAGLKFPSVLDAVGRVPDAVFSKAAKHRGIPDASYGIGSKVFVKGYRQVAVAREVGVPRQKVHSVCADLLETINQFMSDKGRAR